jgi:hypothetical protein
MLILSFVHMFYENKVLRQIAYYYLVGYVLYEQYYNVLF